MAKSGTWREQQFTAGSLQDIYSKRYVKDTTGLINASNVTNMQQVAKIALSGKEGEKAVSAQLSRLRHIVKRRLEGFKNSPVAMESEAYKKGVYELSRNPRKMTAVQKAQALTQMGRWLSGQVTSYNTGAKSYVEHVKTNIATLQKHGYGFVKTEKDLKHWGNFMEFVRVCHIEEEMYNELTKAENIEERKEIAQGWFNAYLNHTNEVNALLAEGKNQTLKEKMTKWSAEERRALVKNDSQVSTKRSSSNSAKNRNKRKRPTKKRK